MKKVYLCYDGVENSAFYSQFFLPMRTDAQKPGVKVIFISFEKSPTQTKKAWKKFEGSTKIQAFFLHRLPFVGRWLLFLQAAQLAKKLKNIGYADQFICRGIIVAWILGKALSWLSTFATKIDVWIPGLAAEESLFFAKGFLRKTLVQLRYPWLKTLEKEVLEKICFSERSQSINFFVVSEAMKELFLQKYRKLKAKEVQILPNPKTPSLTAEEMLLRKGLARQSLKIPDNAVVYCYSGSMKPWQCFEQAVDFFQKKLTQDPLSFFLVITQEKAFAKQILEEKKVNKDRVLLLSVKPNAVAEKIQAADFGLVFRQPHIINWVSRPLKALEFRRNGLVVLHNNTVGWIIKNC